MCVCVCVCVCFDVGTSVHVFSDYISSAWMYFIGITYLSLVSLGNAYKHNSPLGCLKITSFFFFCT